MGVLALAATFAASDNRPIFEHNLHTKYEFTSLITSYPISGGRFSPSVAGIEIHQAEPQEIVLNVDGDAKVYLLTLNLQTNEPTLHDTKTGQPTTTILK